jgi:hypothetical protein
MLTLINVALTTINLVFVYLIRKQNKITRNHLRQIEKKIDETYTQLRSDKYAHPSAYHFVEKKF